MAISAAACTAGEDSSATIRSQLDRILASATFQQVDRLKRFLSFIVLEAVAGRSDQLKEYVVGVQVFGKEALFDPRTDPVVRVQARRLRARLQRYYRDEGQADEVVIELPKGGYAPVFKRRESGMVPRRSGATALLRSRNTVTVMRFADDSPGGDFGYFCEGLRQEIIHRLTALEHVRVLASAAVDRGDAQEHRALHTDAALILTGSVRVARETVRITAQLVDSATGSYLWSESIDGDAADVFGTQERAARLIVSTLEPAVKRHANAPRRPTENLAAHNLYLQGRYHLNQRTEEGLHKAVDFFEKSLHEDAEYAPAHSGLADAYTLLGHYGMVGPADVWTKAAASASAAVILDGNSAEAHTSFAHVKSTQEWDFAAAERGFQRAIALDPRYATAHHWYAVSCLAPLGRLDEALEHMLVALSIDPVSAIIARDLAVIHFYRRDFDAALDQCDQTIELNPHFSPAYWTLGLIQELRGDLDESVAALQRAVHLSPNSSRMQAALARSLAMSGKRQLAMRTLRNLEQLAKARYVSPFDFASIYFGLGHSGPGFRWLTKAGQDRAFELISIKVDPRFDVLRSDPRFSAVVRQAGLD
jgi:serine/threonine-protein kinase